jgi:FMN phosphatase YigB (HAD superfamily)
MVGDNFDADVAGAQRVGISGHWYNPEGLPAPATAQAPYRTLTKLSELLV